MAAAVNKRDSSGEEKGDRKLERNDSETLSISSISSSQEDGQRLSQDSLDWSALVTPPNTLSASEELSRAVTNPSTLSRDRSQEVSSDFGLNPLARPYVALQRLPPAQVRK